MSEAAGYLSATRKCDMVMKGGITSGVVYPRAVCELARSFRFVNIGGASAGAIAAAIAAAAEFARAGGSDHGFRRLEGIADELGASNPSTKRSNLLSLFHPNDETAPLFDLLLFPLIEKKSAVARFLGSLLRHAPLTLLAFAPSVVLVMLAARTGDTALLLFSIVCAALLGGLLFAAGTVAVLLASLRALPENFFGLCSGMGAPYALSEWLSRTIDEVAGKTSGPLTFGDLERAGIHLQTVTTSLTHGRPYTLPFDTGGFFFRPDEWARLFPKNVMKVIEEAARAKASLSPGGRGKLPEGLLPLPDGDDLPVVVAARMSLSFPLLISAVPLHVVDYTLRVNREAKKQDGPLVADRCWFSDGGISSNFPIHLFDQPLPRWPTFGLNLKEFHPDRGRSEEERENVWMIETLGEGSSETLTRFDRGSVVHRVSGFLVAIMNTMQNWRDNLQMRAPGYRDRIVHVNQDEDEGGLNLEMGQGVIERLARRGGAAGEVLRERFTNDAEEGNTLTWKAHRWTRYRSTMSLLFELLNELADVYSEQGDPSYADLIAQPHHHYDWADSRSKAAVDATNDLFTIARKYRTLFAAGAPRPTPDLRIVPRM